MTAPDLHGLSGISAFGEADAAAVAQLSAEILAWAGDAIADRTGAHLQKALEELSQADVGDAALL